MDDIEGNNFTEILLNQFVENETLYKMLNEEESITELSCLLQLQHERIKKNLTKRQNFHIAKILENECPWNIKKTALNFALHIQADNEEFIHCLCWFNGKLSAINFEMKSADVDVEHYLELLYVAAVISDVNSQNNEDIFQYIDKFKLKMFLLKMSDLKLSKDVLIDETSLFFKYLELISLKDPIFIDEALEYFIQEENFDLLCLMFDRNLSNVVCRDYFQEDILWNFFKSHINSDNNLIKKKIQYILWKVIEHLKSNSSLIPTSLKTETFNEWDFFFILLETSKEKQLHLIQPTLKLLESITTLHLTWKICIYRELLNHSQLSVVYSVVKHILKSKFCCDQVHQGLLGDILVALNKFEYSHLSKEVFSKLEVFCKELNEDCFFMVFDEFLKIDWNPAAAWCVLKGISPILYKTPENLIIKMLTCLKKLPHMYIKYSCIILFIKKLLYKSSTLFENLIIIGKFLFSSNVQMDKEVFYLIIEEMRTELENYSEMLEEMLQRSIRDQNLEYLVITLELMEKLNLDVQNKLEFVNSTSDILLFYFPNLMEPLGLENYLVKRFENDDPIDYKYLLKYLENSIDQGTVNISSEGCSNIWYFSQASDDKRFIASYLVCRMTEICVFFDLTLREQAESYLKQFGYVTNELWIKKMRKSGLNDKHLNEICQKFLELLENDDEKTLKLIVDNIDLMTNFASIRRPHSIDVLDACLKKLCILPNNLMRDYSVSFFKSLFKKPLFSIPKFAVFWEKWYRDLFQSYFMECDTIVRTILDGCRKIILWGAPYANILTPFILSALNKGIVLQKNERVMYGVCEDIYTTIGSLFLENPNIISSELKMLSMECLHLFAEKSIIKSFPSADTLMEMLLNLYMENYNKRYFPDSKIHLEKLRIIQVMFMLVHLADSSKNKVVKFILKSLCEESHQPSVKQLMQWLLIILVSKLPDHLSLIILMVGTANLSRPSSIVALIPVVYHLVISHEDEEYWFEVTDALLPWTMGANFKLRVYSQMILKNILLEAERKNLTKFVDKYSFLIKSISSVLDATGSSISETLKKDMIFIEAFQPFRYYSLENILVSLPKMLDVPSYEWQNSLDHKFSGRFDMKILSEYYLPGIYYQRNIFEKVEDVSSNFNVQKKIIPWRQDLEERIDNKTLNSLICVASLVEKCSNIGGLSRTCEIYNVKHLVLHNMKIRDDKEFKNLSMSSENWVDFMEVKKDDLSNFLMKLREQGYSIVGLEQTFESVKLDQFKFDKKTVILLGNEKEGIPAPLLRLLDNCVEIPQFGQTRSLNVHVAGAIFIWEYVKQHML